MFIVGLPANLISLMAGVRRLAIVCHSNITARLGFGSGISSGTLNELARRPRRVLATDLMLLEVLTSHVKHHS